ncbi:XRE family transcriptional regulator [bacterium]|nr:MAG: XRE family transcriptional regulator [bacterium]
MGAFPSPDGRGLEPPGAKRPARRKGEGRLSAFGAEPRLRPERRPRPTEPADPHPTGLRPGWSSPIGRRIGSGVIALQLRQAMKDRNLTLSAMAAEMETSRAQLNRVLDPDAANVTLETLSRAAKVVGRGLKVELV